MEATGKRQKPIVFLDRDGVINQDSEDYIKNPSEFHFIPRSPEAVALLNRHGFEVIVITNQSLIGRKMADLPTLEAIFDEMKTGIEQAGGRIRDIFFCPHAPEEGCDCRKPKPGLIFKAAQVHGIDPAEAVMVGDSAKDIECGRNAGCGRTCLVATGNGQNALKDLNQKGMSPDYLGTDLYDVAEWIIKNTDRS